MGQIAAELGYWDDKPAIALKAAVPRSANRDKRYMIFLDQIWLHSEDHYEQVTDRDFKLEDGEWYPVMHQLMDALILQRLTGTEWTLANLIMRWAFSWHKPYADLKWKFIKEKTGLSGGTISKAFKKLEQRNIIKCFPQETKTYTRYRINSKVSSWKSLSKSQGCFPQETKSVSYRKVHPLKNTYKEKKTSREAGSALGAAVLKFDPDVVENASIRKILADIDLVCDKLIEADIFPKAHLFKSTMLKKGQNERAILHALSKAFLKKTFERGAWAYCTQILKVENGNYNEKEHRQFS